MSTTAVRKQAPRPARPAARYWKGKAPKGVTEVDSDSDAEDAPEQVGEPGDVPIEGEQVFEVGDGEDEDEDEGGGGGSAAAGGVRVPVKEPRKAMNIALRDVNISRDGKVTVAGREESGRTALEVDEEEEEESEEEETRGEGRPGPVKRESEESSEYESGSDEDDDEEQPKLQFRPVFVPKRARETIAARDGMAQDTPEALQRKEAEAEERRRQSHNLVAESIRQELAEKEKEEVVPDIDDTDGVDPEAEFEAWRLRELGRIKRDKEAEVRRQEELEEIERRRAMPEEQRLKEDMERAQKSREEKPKGQQKFLQKYWHKGAFHQDQEILKKRDYTEATESTIDVSLLPKVMQVKNFGKRSRTKYTHLLDQDTTIATGGFGGVAPVKQGGKGTDTAGCFLCGGPHLKRDCPQNTGPVPPGESGGSGANAAPLQMRPWGERRENGSWGDRNQDRRSDPRESGRDRDRDDRREAKDGYGRWRSQREDRARRRSYSRSRSRSRSPPPPRRPERERRRPGSVDGEYREKRRRLD